MDIFAHTLWANAGARGANALAEKSNLTKEAIKKFYIIPAWTAFFGVFPDLFAFTIPFIFRFYTAIFEENSFAKAFGRPEMVEGGVPNGFELAHTLYDYSHSLVIWAVVFLIVWFIFKRPRYELFGWALHILIDIPTHVIAFFPTPFLFPISDYRFPYGIQWSERWFMITNYSLLLIVWGGILLSKLRKRFQ